MLNQAQNPNQNSNLEQNQIKKQSPPKKPLLSDTVKILLAVLFFTALAAIIIGSGCFINGRYKNVANNQINNPIISMVNKTQCEINSDCWLVYVDDYICLPCDTSLEKYQCLNTNEVKKLRDKRNKRDESHPVLCSRCEVEFDKYICECENGKCEKIKEKSTLDVSNWQTYRNEEFGFEMKYPEYYTEDRYDLENMTDLDYKRIHFFRDMSDNALNDFKKHYITSLHEDGTHSGTIDIKSYNENELKAWYAIDSFNDLKFKEYGNFKVYISEIGEVGFYYIISHNNVDNLYFVFNIPASLQNNFENNWLSTFKFINQNTSISDIIKENKKIEYLADFEFQNLPDYVFQEQKGATYKFGNYIFQFIKQPNLNTPLSISSSDIKWKGVLYSKDSGLSWNDFFVIDNPIDCDGNEVKYNPAGMFVDNNKLYLDISDDRGAGSGEGNLLRYYTEDGKIWTRDSCLYLFPESYFINKINGSNGVDPLSSAGNSGCVYSPVSLCTDEPFGIAIGGYVYPIDIKYKRLNFLGQLFTAANCGKKRLSQIDGVDGENYTLGPRIILKNNPSQELIDVFKSIGFDCCGKVPDSECKEWSHDNYSIKINELLKLEPYHENFNSDDCVNCG